MLYAEHVRRERHEDDTDEVILLAEIRDLLELILVLLTPAPVPTRIGVVLYDLQGEKINMANFQLQDNQSVVATVDVLDEAGQVVPGAAIDAGTLVASCADAQGNASTALSFTNPSGGTGGFTINATGVEASGLVVSVSGSYQAKALTPATLTFDVVASPAGAVGVTLGTPTP